MEVEQQDCGADSDHEIDQPTGDEVHRDVERRAHHAEIEVAGHREIGGQFGSFEVGDAGRCDADREEAVVEVGGHPSAEVRRHQLMQGLGDQQQRERGAHHHQRAHQRHVAGDGTDQPSEGDRRDRRQGAAQNDQRPPSDRVGGSGAAQSAEELPLLPTSQPIDHLLHLAMFLPPHSHRSGAAESAAPIICF